MLFLQDWLAPECAFIVTEYIDVLSLAQMSCPLGFRRDFWLHVLKHRYPKHYTSDPEILRCKLQCTNLDLQLIIVMIEHDSFVSYHDMIFEDAIFRIGLALTSDIDPTKFHLFRQTMPPMYSSVLYLHHHNITIPCTYLYEILLNLDVVSLNQYPPDRDTLLDVLFTLYPHVLTEIVKDRYITGFEQLTICAPALACKYIPAVGTLLQRVNVVEYIMCHLCDVNTDTQAYFDLIMGLVNAQPDLCTRKNKFGCNLRQTVASLVIHWPDSELLRMVNTYIHSAY